MSQSRRPSLPGLLAFLAAAALWYLVHKYFGQTEGFRVWGIALLVICSVLALRLSISVSVGRRQYSPLVGWRKAYALVPGIAIGLVVTFFPHEVACAVNLKGYVCA